MQNSNSHVCWAISEHTKRNRTLRMFKERRAWNESAHKHKVERTEYPNNEIKERKKRKSNENYKRYIVTNNGDFHVHKWNKIVPTVKNSITLSLNEWFYCKEKHLGIGMRWKRRRAFQFDFAYRLVVPFMYVLRIHFIIDANISRSWTLNSKRMRLRERKENERK